MLPRANRVTETASVVQTRECPRRLAQEALGLGGDTLHELDYEDLALTPTAMGLVRRAAVAVLERFAPGQPGGLSPSQALALFLDHVFWDEASGGLILCADFPGQSFCLPIPCSQWGLRQRPGRVQ